MKSVVSQTSSGAERAAAGFIAARLAQAIETHGRASLATSGGETPWGMFDRLAEQAVRWDAVHVFQVDERRAPAESAERNWTRFLSRRLASCIPPANLHPAPVEVEPAERAAQQYEEVLIQHLGEPPVFDVVHLGLGADGHTASLFAGDPLLEERTRWAGISRAPGGVERLSLTIPTLNQARHIVWFVLGAERREIVARLLEKDPQLPASLVSDRQAVLFTERAAAPER